MLNRIERHMPPQPGGEHDSLFYIEIDPWGVFCYFGCILILATPLYLFFFSYAIAFRPRLCTKLIYTFI